eukprot:6649992-Pyramimonas_sp.AAC.1
MAGGPLRTAPSRGINTVRRTHQSILFALERRLAATLEDPREWPCPLTHGSGARSRGVEVLPLASPLSGQAGVPRPWPRGSPGVPTDAV